ncbi:MAG: AAC(3) family N-acetyltransferase, partial [Candidatus Sumerlaeia bacterium]|nr:AAC(3) family N-acetyltransferase [Candidatus Sumerlaeia bacterium]
GATVLVHSSLSSFGYVSGGADTVIDTLLEVVGETGTVMVPTLTGSEKLSVSNPPVFDVRHTPCWTGIIPETFRKRNEALRSLHPTHSVAAIGAQAKFLTEGHETCITPCGKDSPYHKLALVNGWVLLLGVDLNCCTLFHTVEEFANVPYHLQPEWVTAKIIDYAGVERYVKIKIHRYGSERDFPKMEPILLNERAISIGKIGKAIVRLISANKLIELTLKKLAQDPEFLLKK